MRRRLIALAAVVCGALALTDAAGRWQAGASSSSATATASGALLARGSSLFTSSCASCHGMKAQGIPGRGPDLRGAGALAADFYLQTGRMPLASPRAQPQRSGPAFSQGDIAALVAYVGSFGGPGIPFVTPARGSLPEGQRLFGMDCAGCHSIQGQGGIVTGAVVPSLGQASARQIGEAVRIGPYVMPRFGERELSAGQVNSIARYIQSTQSAKDLGGWGIGRIGPIPEGMVAWLLAAAALLLIARLIGERTGERETPHEGGP